MLFTHGWGGNRYQHRDKMEYVCEQYNLICLATEFRQSGFDFDSQKGIGSLVPYDASFYQVFDVLNALRTLLSFHSDVNRKRIYHYGSSQGGHIALLSSIFAPDVFAFIFASSPMTHIDARKAAGSGREFCQWELLVRDVRVHADMIHCPVYLEHGTADDNVPCIVHTGILESALLNLNKKVVVRYYENGKHDLQPASDKLTAFKSIMTEQILRMEKEYPDDFLVGSHIAIPCGKKTLHINWSKPSQDAALFYWENSASDL